MAQPKEKPKQAKPGRGRAAARVREVLPIMVDEFDALISRGGLKRGDTILLSGGCGTGKTTFAIQSVYNALHNGERAAYLTLEERPEKIKENMRENFGWDLQKFEEKGTFVIIKLDAIEIARAVEAMIEKTRGGLFIESQKFELPLKLKLPFKPDRVVVDSLSALSITFVENKEGYRQYLRLLFEVLEGYGSANIVIGETEQEPGIYSRTGIEEFLADGVVVLYNLQVHNTRQKALEILKLRSSDHLKKIVPYKITPEGIKIFPKAEIFRK